MTTTLTVITKEEVPTFIRSKGELSDLLKTLQPASKVAVRLLVDAMNDEKLDQKTRIMCAEKIIMFHISTADKVNQDIMNRLIAEIKVRPGGATKKLTTGNEDENSLPELDFDNIKTL